MRPQTVSETQNETFKKSIDLTSRRKVLLFLHCGEITKSVYHKTHESLFNVIISTILF